MSKCTKDGIPLPVVGRKSQKSRRWKHFGALGIVLATGLVWLSHGPSQYTLRNHSRPPPSGPRISPEEAEGIFLTVPNAESALEASREYATHPHLAGSSEDFEDAQAILKLFQDELGIPPPTEQPIFEAGTRQSRWATIGTTRRFGPPKRPTAWIDTYFPVLNTPLDRQLEILDTDGNVAWEADLVEDGNILDEDAGKYKDAVPTWHGLSFDGTATGQLVYANYGTQDDYKVLLAKGVNFTDKIVLTRYGGIFRGLKIKGAAELGASGVLIYSDPRDDGYVTENNGYLPYPLGPARNPTSVQRGSVQYLSIYPGDPTTPGYPSYKDAERQEPANVPTIPSLPISWNNAHVLLKELGSNVHDGRQLNGQLSQRKIKIVNHVDNKVTPIWNTMASIPGHIHDEVVLIGCHRDAWVLGAADPTSGTVSLREIVRGFGELLKKGWKPLRTIVIASWDGEEYGLVGSTEWGEDFEKWISGHVVAYLNVDVSVSGSRWNVAGSPSLAHLIHKTALDIPHPNKSGKTLWDAREDIGPFKGPGNSTASIIDLDFKVQYEQDDIARKAIKTGISPLGSGSDFTVFLQRIGIASSDEGFGYTNTDAVYHYHSVYDTQRWQEVFADPSFEKHVAVAKHLGLLGLRLIDAIVLPLNTTQYALELDDYLEKVKGLAAASKLSSNFTALEASIKRVQEASFSLDVEKEEAERKFRELLDKLPKPKGLHATCKGPARRFWQRIVSQARQIFGLGDSQAYLESLTPEHLLGLASLEADDNAVATAGYHIPPIFKLIQAARRIVRVNKQLVAFERGFIAKDGIRDREWYKHLGVAPGKWLGYGATTFPALTEAVTDNLDSAEIQYEAFRLTLLLNQLAETITPKHSKCG
ncbi:Zn-dependent exopeptidase [Coprinopsis marcescibilis]|uniref:Zn-dependent exopeptidase n=1 Tax=Coprinopsis marcescibilis TaxID=230819 RepID=A0A5C3L789_COPMA|nr:Zn-dependent exopeptidase [Coprinopsis marcescibilis]